MTETRELPHDPYITAVVDALTAAGLEPTTAETRDTEENRFDPDTGTELDALLVWNGDASGLDPDVHEDGIALLWEHPAEQWQWAPRKQHGELEHEPDFLPNLGRWSAPASVVATVRALLTGEPLPEGYAPYWHPADSVRRAIAAWESGEDPTPDADQPQPCGEGMCRCYGQGSEHADCACGCDCPRDEDGQLIDD